MTIINQGCTTQTKRGFLESVDLKRAVKLTKAPITANIGNTILAKIT